MRPCALASEREAEEGKSDEVRPYEAKGAPASETQRHQWGHHPKSCLQRETKKWNRAGSLGGHRRVIAQPARGGRQGYGGPGNSVGGGGAALGVESVRRGPSGRCQTCADATGGGEAASARSSRAELVPVACLEASVLPPAGRDAEARADGRRWRRSEGDAEARGVVGESLPRLRRPPPADDCVFFFPLYGKGSSGLGRCE